MAIDLKLTYPSNNFNFLKVSHRYKSFAELHTSLQKELALHKDELPAKRLIKDVKFLETRRQDLEKYLQKIITTVHQLPVIPQSLLKFLDFHKYDIVFLHQAMAGDISQKQIQTSSFTVLEVRSPNCFHGPTRFTFLLFF